MPLAGAGDYHHYILGTSTCWVYKWVNLRPKKNRTHRKLQLEPSDGGNHRQYLSIKQHISK